MNERAARPELCVGAVATRTNELLMVRRATEPGRGRWSLPGGRVEHGETIAEAVVRELEEETGLEGVCGSLVGWTEILDDLHHYVVMDFEVTIMGTSEPSPGDDASEAEWVAVWDVPERDLIDGLAEFLSEHGVIETIA
ncbi:MAG: NUDIX domain-containing protein [Microthrixaceae bacterium]